MKARLGVGALAATLTLSCALQAVAQEPFRPGIDIPAIAFDHEELRPAFWRFDGIRPTRAGLAYLILPPGPNREERRAIVAVDDRFNPQRAFFLDGDRPTAVADIDPKTLHQRIDRELWEKANRAHPGSGLLTVRFADAHGQARSVRLRIGDSLADHSEKFAQYQCLTVPRIFTLESRGRSESFVILLSERDPNLARFDPRCRGDADFVKPSRFLFLVPTNARFAFSDKRLVFVQGPWIVSIPYDIGQQEIERSRRLITQAQLKRLLETVPLPPDGGGPPYQSDDELQATVDAALEKLLEAKGPN